MTGDVNSIEFFRLIAKSKADIDESGAIDSDEERSIFDTELQKYDVNSDGKLDTDDIDIIKEKLNLTIEEKEKFEQIKKFNENHPNFNIETATQEEVDEYNALYDKIEGSNLSFTLDFANSINGVMDYFVKTKDTDNYNLYENSVDEFNNGTAVSKDNNDTTEITSTLSDEIEPDINTQDYVTTGPIQADTPEQNTIEDNSDEENSILEIQHQNYNSYANNDDFTSVQPQVQSQYTQPRRSFGSVTQRANATQLVKYKSLDETLSELKTKRTELKTKITEKRQEVGEIKNDNTLAVKEAKQARDLAKAEYIEVLKNNKGTKKYGKQLEKNEKNIEKNIKDIKNTETLIETLENSISETNININSLKSNIDGYTTAISRLPALSGKESDIQRDEKIRVKRTELNNKKNEAQKKYNTLEQLLKKYNEQLDGRKQEKEKLEQEKEKLEEEKAEIEEKIKQFDTEETKNKREILSNTEIEYNKVKSAELQKTQMDLDKLVQELNNIETKINEAENKKIISENTVTNKPDIKNVPASDISRYGIHETTLPDGTPVLACNWSSFSKCQPEWLEQQKHMLRAADELGLTLVYSDVERTVAASNARRARKGNLVAAGGESPHNYGVAVDIVLYKDGQPINVNSSAQSDFAKKAQEYSGGKIEWGGNWTKAGERHHFELNGWRGQYKRPEYLVG